MATSFNDGLLEALHNGVCDSARYGVTAGLIFSLVTAETGAGIAIGAAAAAASALTYASFCNNPLPPEFLPAPPFSGGQCGGIGYRVRTRQHYTDNRNGTGGEQLQDNFVTGPITKIQFGVTPNSLGQTFLIIDAAAGSVNQVPNPGLSDNGTDPRYSFSNFRTEVSRPDGQIDSCGSPPTVAPPIPPGNNDHHDTINYNDNSNNPVSVPITIRFGLGDILSGNRLNIPISLTLNNDPTTNVGGNLDITNNKFTFNFGDQAHPDGGGADNGGGDVVTPPGLPAPPPAVAPPPLPGDPPHVPGDPLPPTSPVAPPKPPSEDTKVSQRKILRGAIVTSIQVSSVASKLIQGENPDIFVPALGYIQFLIQIGNATAWTEEIPVKNTRQVIECPWALGAIDVKGTARGNGTFAITPVYTKITYNPRFPPES